MKKFEKDDKKVRRHLMNHVTNPIFDLFITSKFVKIVWEKLEVKYRAHDARKKNFVVGEWLRLQITNDKPIMEHVHVYENLCSEVS